MTDFKTPEEAFQKLSELKKTTSDESLKSKISGIFQNYSSDLNKISQEFGYSDKKSLNTEISERHQQFIETASKLLEQPEKEQAKATPQPAPGIKR